ncbi:hypothetical protein OSB04_007976 [Centaurea solstitialis]|uniref:RING-type domain-containing protein n=1 Tax=Centaurea solstitialis TaxID=347529 RepID=A0AA38TYN4_9ASTR|nr:hypothetical protein OSB04_007976 [Centaurea solstitialis]
MVTRASEVAEKVIRAIMVLVLFFVLCCKSCQEVHEDIETGRRRSRPPTRTSTTTHVVHHVVRQQQAAPVASHHREERVTQPQRVPSMKPAQYTSGSERKNDECVICMEEFEEMETIRVVVGCQHLFHTHCIYQWFVLNQTCPICRQVI